MACKDSACKMNGQIYSHFSIPNRTKRLTKKAGYACFSKHIPLLLDRECNYGFIPSRNLQEPKRLTAISGRENVRKTQPRPCVTAESFCRTYG